MNKESQGNQHYFRKIRQIFNPKKLHEIGKQVFKN
jgi:hypothetical protein